jgi:hypothetical protein
MKRKGMSQDLFESTAKLDELEVYWSKKVAYLNLVSQTPFKKISVAAKSLNVFAELHGPFDPLINANFSPNPWHIKEGKKATVYPDVKRNYRCEDIKLWNYSFDALLNDPAGLGLFREFVNLELSVENLEFWERVNLLEKTSTKDEFKIDAVKIYKEFIEMGSEKEINIPSYVKGPISLSFVIEGDWEIPYDCYSTAKDHIFTLMQKDTYPRFCTSTILGVFAQKIKAGKGEKWGGRSKELL